MGRRKELTMNYYPGSLRGVVKGGRCQLITLNGYNELRGNLKCKDFHLHGSLVCATKVTPRLTCSKMFLDGSLNLPEIICSTAYVSGTSEITGDVVIAHEFIQNGRFSGHGKLTANSMRVYDRFSHDGKLFANQFAAHACLSVGPIKAGNVLIEFSDRSRCAEITAGSVIVQRAPLPLLARLFYAEQASRNSFLTVTNGIKADYVELEYVTTDSVTGLDVNIGPGCIINEVRYRDHISISDQAWVGHYAPIDETVNVDAENK